MSKIFGTPPFRRLFTGVVGYGPPAEIEVFKGIVTAFFGDDLSPTTWWMRDLMVPSSTQGMMEDALREKFETGLHEEWALCNWEPRGRVLYVPTPRGQPANIQDMVAAFTKKREKANAVFVKCPYIRFQSGHVLDSICALAFPVPEEEWNAIHVHMQISAAAAEIEAVVGEGFKGMAEAYPCIDSNQPVASPNSPGRRRLDLLRRIHDVVVNAR